MVAGQGRVHGPDLGSGINGPGAYFCLFLSLSLLLSPCLYISLPLSAHLSLCLCFSPCLFLCLSTVCFSLSVSAFLCLSWSHCIFFYLPLSVVSLTGRSGSLSDLFLTPAPTPSPLVQVG